jgi:hypothetical protein
MAFRVVSGLMAAIFVLAVAVQYNDPDPARWMLLYAAAAAVALTATVRGRAPIVASVGVGLIALAWSAATMTASLADLGTYQHMFDAWEMKNAPIEEAREASGLLIVVAWMTAAVVHWIVTKRSSRATSF